MCAVQSSVGNEPYETRRSTMFVNIPFFGKSCIKNRKPQFSSLRFVHLKNQYAAQYVPLRAEKRTKCHICGFDVLAGAQIVVISNHVSHRHCAISSLVSRVNPGLPIKPSIFSACHCGGLRVRGVCRSCGWSTSCCCCGAVKQPNGSWISVEHEQGEASHSMCPDCLAKHYPEFVSTHN